MMIRNNQIRTLEQLRQEQILLKASYLHQEEALKADVKSYLSQFTLGHFLRKFTRPSELFKLDDKTNLTGKAMSLLLPLLLNKTFFRGSGFITKSLAALVSGKIGQSMDAKNLSGIFNMAKSLFKSKKKKDNAFVDYGIPPDSETY